MPSRSKDTSSATVCIGLLALVALVALVSAEVEDATWIHEAAKPQAPREGMRQPEGGERRADIQGHGHQSAMVMIFHPLTRIGLQKGSNLVKEGDARMEVGAGGGVTEDGVGVWEGQPQAVKRHDPKYFEKILDMPDIQKTLDACVAVNGTTGQEPMWNAAGTKGSDFRLVKRTRGPDGEWWSGGVPGDTLNASVIRDYVQKKGFTLVLNHLDFRVDGVANMARSLEKQTGIAVQANLYLTPPASQGFEVHWDPMETIVLQVAGRKLWHIYDPLVALPRPEQRFKPTAAQVNQTARRSVILEAGDTLYIPRGWMHEATTAHSDGQEGEHSMHITVGVDAQTLTTETLAHLAVRQISRASGVGDEMHWCIRGAAEQDERLRRGLWGRTEAPQEACDVAREVLEGCEEETGKRLMEAASGKFGDMQMWISHSRGTRPEPGLPKGTAFSILRKDAAASVTGQACLSTLEHARIFGRQAPLKRDHQRAQVLARHQMGPKKKKPGKTEM
mmetsp:Transcript_4369/g.9984  ORF Transcript_4369/g.9984 Transcript_4369/m.9984 type:complete len:504 (+) Transcript_4369:116-1627(+)